ncbi:hypothetical protein, partial [Pseudomonas sp. SDO52101_S400]
TVDLLHAMQALSQLSYSPSSLMSSLRTGRILRAYRKAVKLIFEKIQNFLSALQSLTALPP